MTKKNLFTLKDKAGRTVLKTGNIAEIRQFFNYRNLEAKTPDGKTLVSRGAIDKNRPQIPADGFTLWKG